MIVLGVDECVAVEPDGTEKVYATAPDGYAWIVDGTMLRNVSARGPLTVSHVTVVGAGVDSVIHLPSGKVDKPVFVREYSAAGGKVLSVGQGNKQ